MTLGRLILWACSLAGLGFSLAAAWFGPPAPWIVATVFLAYWAVILGGVFVPRLGMYATVYCNAPTAERQVALTFEFCPVELDTRSAPDVSRHRSR